MLILARSEDGLPELNVVLDDLFSDIALMERQFGLTYRRAQQNIVVHVRSFWRAMRTTGE